MGNGVQPAAGDPGKGDVVIALYSFPHLHPDAYACSHPLLMWVPLDRLLARMLTHTQARSQHTCPLLVHEHTYTWALCLSGKLNHSGRCLYPHLLTWYVHTQPCLGHSRTPSSSLMHPHSPDDMLVSYSNHSKNKVCVRLRGESAC